MAIELTRAQNANERLALRFLRSLEDGSFTDALRELCTEDFVWANSGLPTLNGQAEIRAHMAAGSFAAEIPILKTMASFSADLIHIASSGDVVFTERLDHHWDAQGRDLMTPHIAGVIEIRDGKISALRDFYDVACYQQTPREPAGAEA
jgi:limonene-1,2-epoxide hydrolase